MALTLAPEMEKRLRTVAAGRGLAPEQTLEALLGEALSEAEAEMQETLAGLRVSAGDFAAGRWTTPEELDETLRAQQRKRVAGLEGFVVKSAQRLS